MGSIPGPFSQKSFSYVNRMWPKYSLWQKESLLTRSVPEKAFVSFLIFRPIISILKSACYQEMYGFPVQAKTYRWITHFLLSKCAAIFYVQKSNLFPERSNSGKMHQKYIQKNTMNRSSMPQIAQPVVLSSSLALEAQRHGDLCMEHQLSTKKIIFYFSSLQRKNLENVKKNTTKRFRCETFQTYYLLKIRGF